MKKLETAGKLQCVINQNIDNLLQSAGVNNVLDLHGNITKFRCISACGKEHTKDDFIRMLKEQGIPRCECGGIVRPNTVLFDEWLNDDIFDASYHQTKKADLFISIGSSLVVRPACTLLDEINDNCKLVILNKGETPYDKKATLVINDPCGEVLERVANEL